MTNQRSTGNARTGEHWTPAETGPTSHTLPTSSPTSSDVSGRLALVLAGFALAVVAFLIILVAIAANSA
ncbi:MAG TPA: hypothetical protein VEW66_07640 [Thermomicrobiales bacterium]|nr:hypothetical protein [Thermomicrobiales bacterium]